MVIACFTNRYSNTIASGLWQYDYGQSLRVQGLTLPTAVEIHFSLHETGGESVTRVGVTKDGATDVIIPDSMLEGNGSVRDYKIYAFIYLADEKSGETTHKIIMPVKARPKPEAFDVPEDAELFREAIAAVNEAVENAKESVVPVIGENGNWFVGGEDTGKPSTGKKGDTGNDGVSVTHEWDGTVLKVTSASGTTSADLKGEKGDKGDTGAQGSQGVKGETGATGPRGETGPQGEKGEKGDTGAQGPQGIQGATGPKGDKGDTGAQGPKGEKGDKGDPGTDGRDGVGSWNDLEDKPFYEEEGLVEILPETTFIAEDDVEEAPLNLTTDLVIGKSYTVILNGETYECVAWSWDTGGFKIPTIGNYGIISGNIEDSTGEPFIVASLPKALLDDEVDANALLACSIEGGITISISADDTVIHHLDPKYIKDMYYTEENEVEIEILPEVSFTTSYKSNDYIEMQAGDTCIVTMNGVQYTCVAKAVEDESEKGFALGNRGLLQPDDENPDTGEPFMITIADKDSIESAGCAVWIVAFAKKDDGSVDLQATVTISISKLVKEEIVHPIPSKYIDVENLELEWNPTRGEEYCVAEERSVDKNNTYIEEVKYKTLASDQHLIVYFDSVRYDLELFDWGGYFVAQTGDDVPFSINVSRIGVKVYGIDTSTSHTISLYLYKYEQLPARYTHRYVDALPEKGEEVDDVLYEADNAGMIAHLGRDGHVLMYNYSDDGMSKIGYVDRSGYHFREYVGAVLRDCTAALFSVDGVSVGQHLEVESVNNGLVIFKAVDPNVLTSPNGTKYRIAVDDDGTLKAEEITE